MKQLQLFQEIRKCPYCGTPLKLKDVQILTHDIKYFYEKCPNCSCEINDPELNLQYGGFCFEKNR